MKIQQIDAGGAVEFARRSDLKKPACKSRLKRLWQFPNVLSSSSSEKLARAGDDEREKKRDDVGDLDAMVSRFSDEGSHEKPQRGRGASASTPTSTTAPTTTWRPGRQMPRRMGVDDQGSACVL